MLSFDLPPEWLASLLEVLYAGQQGLRALLYALGVTPTVHGQPAWPFEHRLAAEMLLADAGHARRVWVSLVCVGVALVALLGSVGWRRARKPLWGAALLVLVFAPWPSADLLWTPAVATSLHQSPSGFTAQGIVRGQAVYAQHCLRCHGADARGEGPDAPQLAMWPPTLNGALLWKRLDGELFWRVRHGLQARDGTQTMPGFAGQLSDAQVWQVLDYLQAHAAGQMLRESGRWDRPVRLPDMPVLCRQGQHPTARSLAGQRVRVVVPGQGAALPSDDPRLVTLAVGAFDAFQSDPDCRTNDAQAQFALALVLGVSGDELPGHQLIVDRSGWLRARGRPGDAAWSEDDLVCRTSPSPSLALVPVPNPVTAPFTSPGDSAAAAVSVATPAQTAGDGLGDLIRRMDAEPVRLQRGGFPH